MELSDLKAYFDPDQPLPKGKEWKPGILLGVSDDDYRAFKGMNSSTLKAGTAAEMWHELNKPPVDKWGESDSAAAKWTDGILTHWAVLEPWRFRNLDDHCVISPTKGLATQRAQAVRAGYPDKLLVTPEHMVTAAKCRAAIEAHPEACRLMASPGENEVSLFWYDKEIGLWKKGRFDRLPLDGNFILDVKTTAKPVMDFKWEVRKYDYHVQAAWYLDLLEALTGERREKFIWLPVTKDEPFMAALWDVDNVRPSNASYGTNILKAARDRIGTRLATFVPSLNETILHVERGGKLTPELVRSFWPAYEHEPIHPVTF